MELPSCSDFADTFLYELIAGGEVERERVCICSGGESSAHTCYAYTGTHTRLHTCAHTHRHAHQLWFPGHIFCWALKPEKRLWALSEAALVSLSLTAARGQ